MNKEEIIRMAKEAGGDDWGIFKDFMPEIERFASLVAAAEREACARICDEEEARVDGLHDLLTEDSDEPIHALSGRSFAAHKIANAIRARGQE